MMEALLFAMIEEAKQARVSIARVGGGSRAGKSFSEALSGCNSALVSFSVCNFRGPSSSHPKYAVAFDFAADDLSITRETPSYLWRKEEKWHVLSYDTALPRSKIDSREDVLFSPKWKVSFGGGGRFSSEEEEDAVLIGSSWEWALMPVEMG